MTQKEGKNKGSEILMYVLMYSIVVFTQISGCSQKREIYRGTDIVLVTTTGIIGDAVKRVAGDSAEVVSIMGPGVDPHLYKATQGDLKKLNSGDVVFYNGLHLEGKMGEVLKKLGRTRPVIAIGDFIPKSKLRSTSDFEGSYDPHIWFDVLIWKEAVLSINRNLNEQFPGKAAIFNNNTEKYLKELDSLHFWVQSHVDLIPDDQRILITSHDAFGYFGKAYNIEVNGLQGLSTLSEAGLRDISDLVKYIVENNIRAVFVETSVSPKAIQAVVNGCRERGHQVKIGGQLYSDALGPLGSGASTYTEMIKHNVKTMVEALK
jgi:manganese/zinc/iron transport system substrate-binding protein